MPLSRETRQAIAKYGPNVNKLARRRYGISGQQLLSKLITGESGGRKNAVSSAGARGEGQFMPGTRNVARQKYGIDPWRSSDEAVHATELHLRGKLTGSKGLEGYNPGGGSTYVKYILGQKVGKDSRGSSSRSTSVGSSVSVRKSSKTTPTFDNAGYKQALAKQAVANIFSHHKGGSVLTRTGVLSTAPVDPAQYRGSKTKTSRTLSGSQGVASKGARSPGKGLAEFEGKKVAAWIVPELRAARAAGWKGKITSGYRSRAEQTRIYNSGVRPAAKPGTSNHEGDVFPRGAVDVTDPQVLAQILKRRKSRLQWAGGKDPVHFSHQHGGSY